MNEATQRVRADHSEQPQNEQNYRDCPEHLVNVPFLLRVCHNQTTQESERGISRELPINEGDLSYLA